jgi:dihydrofolate reductase
MRNLIVQTFLTLDGVMQAPGGPGEDDDGGFAYGGWSVNYWDDQMGQVMAEATSRPFAMVLGRRTYDVMAAYWPGAPEEEGAKVFNDATKYVASRSRPNLEAWSNSVQIEGDAAQGLAALKAEDGPELQVHGSANLIQTLLRHNLVDQYRLWVFPLVLGQAPVRRRHHPRRPPPDRPPGLHHRRGHGHLGAGRRGRDGVVRRGVMREAGAARRTAETPAHGGRRGRPAGRLLALCRLPEPAGAAGPGHRRAASACPPAPTRWPGTTRTSPSPRSRRCIGWPRPRTSSS